MRELRVTAPAQDDLASIVDYLRLELGNDQAAEHFLGALSSAYETVLNNPLVCRTCSDRQVAACGYRAIAIMRYLMIYRYDASDDVVYVVRFFHELQDYAHILLNQPINQ